MTSYSIDRLEQGQWIWCGDGDTDNGTTADLPDEVLDMADAGREGQIEIDGITYRITTQ